VDDRLHVALPLLPQPRHLDREQWSAGEPEQSGRRAAQVPARAEDDGGGFTLSGGEPLMQHRFAAKLLAAAKAMGIHTTIETNGYYGERLTDADLQNIDLVMLGIKSWGSERHRALTGVDIEPTLRVRPAPRPRGGDRFGYVFASRCAWGLNRRAVGFISRPRPDFAAGLGERRAACERFLPGFPPEWAKYHSRDSCVWALGTTHRETRRRRRRTEEAGSAASAGGAWWQPVCTRLYVQSASPPTTSGINDNLLSFILNGGLGYSGGPALSPPAVRTRRNLLN
jgi:hypothetical protein